MITAPKIHTDLLWDLTILFVGLAVLYFFAIFYYRNKYKIKKADTAKRKKKLAPMVSEFLFYHESEGTKDEKNNYINQKIEIRELIKDQKNKTVLSEILLDLKKDVSGETRERLFRLYKDLNLEQEAFNKLKSFKWQKISQGMFELTQMHVTESYGFINRFINDKRSVVRKQAEISTVTLMHEGISYFLDTTKYQISEWQQLKILEVLSNQDGLQPPRFYKWLTSKNRHVVLFALRLIGHYDQNDAEESIISLVRHKNNDIKHEAINCIKKFYFENSRSILKNVFWRNNVGVKLAILDTLADFGNSEDIPFLETVEKIESNFTVKSKALSAINTIHPEYIMPSLDLEELGVDLVEVKRKNADTAEKVISETARKILPVETIDEIKAEIPVNLVENSLESENSDSIISEKEFTEVTSIEKNDIDTKIEAALAHETSQIDSTTIALKQFYEQENIPDDPINSSEVTNTELPASYQSIFKSLFDFSDDFCKLLLLDEILAIGTIKEISFLASLHNHHNQEIRKKAILVKDKLQIRLDAEIQPEITAINDPEFFAKEIDIANLEFSEKDLSANFQNIKNDSNKIAFKGTEGLIPLEFCFLLEELAIKPAKEFDVFDIEFDLEFSSKRADLTQTKASEEGINISKDENGLSKEEHSFFQKLLEFPTNINDIFNG